YQNTNSDRLLSKDSLIVKGKVIEFKGADKILVEDEVLKTLKTIFINQEIKEISLEFNHENVELNIEENNYLNINITKQMDNSFMINLEKKTDYTQNKDWKLIMITAVYR
ncbi:MAG: hypothetical protein ACRCUD_03435, partial [Cetobacterium sp.]